MQKSKLKILADVIVLQDMEELIDDVEFLEDQQKKVLEFKEYTEGFVGSSLEEKDVEYITDLIKKSYAKGVDEVVKKLAAEQAKDNASV